jgi:Na+/melibiose symporter-like transporter
MAFTLGVHLCVVRHWIGGNAIITQGGLFIKNFNPELGHYTSLIINSVQFVFVLIGLVFLQKLMGKKPLFLLSITLLSLINLGLAVGMIFGQILACMFLMCLYMAIYGAAFISPIWAYPSEIIPAS